MSGPYFHGTDAESADNLRRNGITESRLQSRDRGFFGDGFYLTTDYEVAQRHATTVANKRDATPEILRVEMPTADVFPAHEALPEDGLAPIQPPDWTADVVEWHVEKVEQAAVWERIPGTEREDVVPRARRQVTPGAEEFDREAWYGEVTEYAFDTGYDAVRWTPGEIVVRPGADLRFSRRVKPKY